MDFYACLNQRGLFPGPSEDRATFLKRVSTLEHAFQEAKKRLEILPVDDWKRSVAFVKKVFGMAPDWIVAFYSNKKLPFWQGAATWIEGDTVTIQLRRGFKKGAYLGLYQREEVLAHELVHLTRMSFHEPKYEEVFAYLTSKWTFRRFLGGLFRSPKESLIFLLLTTTPPLLVWLNMEKALYVYIAPVAFAGFLFFRLLWAHICLNRCLSKIDKLFKAPLAFCLRLTDREISLFSHISPQKILAFIDRQTSFRWQFIRAVFPKKGATAQGGETES